MKNLILYESYVSTINQDLNPVVNRVPDLSGGYDRLADNYIWEISKKYNLGKGKEYSTRYGNDAWFSKDFLRWCELQRIPVEIVIFPEKKELKRHIAISANGLIIDFTFKKFSGKKDQMYHIGLPSDYKKFGYNPDEIENYPYLPDWIEDIRSPKSKNK